MKERPILFSGPMVRAILDGRKTQTRRLLSCPPWAHVDDMVSAWRAGLPALGLLHDGRPVKQVSLTPYGVPGDRLWVRETWRPVSPEWAAPDGGPVIVRYAGDGAEHMHSEGRIGDWRWPEAARRGMVPAIHMPRWASRIDLEIVSVRVERLQDITEEDARSEGIGDGATEGIFDGARAEFGALWNHINGARATWESNPWVWVINFRRTT